MKDEQKAILDYLGTSYSGAKMMGDEETMLRIARAIAAFKMDTDVDIFEESAVEKYIEKETMVVD